MQNWDTSVFGAGGPVKAKPKPVEKPKQAEKKDVFADKVIPILDKIIKNGSGTLVIPSEIIKQKSEREQFRARCTEYLSEKGYEAKQFKPAYGENKVEKSFYVQLEKVKAAEGAKADVKTASIVPAVVAAPPKMTESEKELEDTAIGNMKLNGFSETEIKDITNTIRNDVAFGREYFLKYVLPELVDLGMAVRDIEKKEGLNGEGVLLSLTMYATAKYKAIEEINKATGRMGEIAPLLFWDMAQALKNLRNFDQNIKNSIESYVSTIREKREGTASVPVEMMLETPFMSLTQPVSLNYIRDINLWSFFPPLEQNLPIEALFKMNGIISDVYVPNKPASQQMITRGIISSAISRVGDIYIRRLPKEAQEFAGTVTGTTKRTKSGGADYSTGALGLAARSEETYLQAETDLSSIYGRIINERVKSKKFDAWVHDLRLKVDIKNPALLEGVLNASFLKDETVDGTGIYVLKKTDNAWENWGYVKRGDSYVYVGKEVVPAGQENTFLGAEVGEMLLKGTSDFYMLASPIPIMSKQISVGGIVDAKAKREMYEMMFDSKTKNFLFTRNPKILLETWKLDQEGAVGMGITGGKPGEDYFKVHYLGGEKQKADVTYWDEKGFLSGGYLNKITEYQKVLETKYRHKDDALFYYALSSTEYVESERKSEEWVGILQKKGLSFQTSNSLNTVNLNKITYTKGKKRLDVDFGSRYGNKLYGISASYPLNDNNQLKMGLTTLENVVSGGKTAYTLGDPFAVNGMGVLGAVAKWEKDGIKQIQNVQSVNVNELPENSAAYTLFTVFGGTKGTAAGDKRSRIFVAAEKGFIVGGESEREDLFPQDRSAGAVYYTKEALDAVKNERKGVTLFMGVERNTGTVFITTNEPKDVEMIYRMGLGYYKIQPGKIWRVDATVEKKDEKTWYTASTSLVTPQAIFWVRGAGSPGTETWEVYAGVSVKFGGKAIEKTLGYMTKPFYWTYLGGKWMIDQLKQAQQ